MLSTYFLRLAALLLSILDYIIEKLKKDFFHLGKLKKEVEFNHWDSFSPEDSGLGTCFSFLGQDFCRVWILGRFGRAGPGFALRTQSPNLLHRLITRGC